MHASHREFPRAPHAMHPEQDANMQTCNDAGADLHTPPTFGGFVPFNIRPFGHCLVGSFPPTDG